MNGEDQNQRIQELFLLQRVAQQISDWSSAIILLAVRMTALRFFTKTEFAVPHAGPPDNNRRATIYRYGEQY